MKMSINYKLDHSTGKRMYFQHKSVKIQNVGRTGHSMDFSFLPSADELWPRKMTTKEFSLRIKSCLVNTHPKEEDGLKNQLDRMVQKLARIILRVFLLMKPMGRFTSTSVRSRTWDSHHWTDTSVQKQSFDMGPMFGHTLGFVFKPLLVIAVKLSIVYYFRAKASLTMSAFSYWNRGKPWCRSKNQIWEMMVVKYILDTLTKGFQPIEKFGALIGEKCQLGCNVALILCHSRNCLFRISKPYSFWIHPPNGQIRWASCYLGLMGFGKGEFRACSLSGFGKWSENNPDLLWLVDTYYPWRLKNLHVLLLDGIIGLIILYLFNTCKCFGWWGYRSNSRRYLCNACSSWSIFAQSMSFWLYGHC